MTTFNLNEALYASKGTDEVVLPSGGVALVSEMTGNEQRNFTNRAKVLNGIAAQELLATCTLSFKDSELPEPKEERIKFVTGLLSGDRNALLFGIRCFSIGDTFEFHTSCPDCQKTGAWEVDLSDKSSFKVKPYLNGDAHYVEYTSTVAEGLKIKFKHLDGFAEIAALKLRNRLDSLTDLELRIPEAWDGATWSRMALAKTREAIISEMRKTIRLHEGGVDTTVRVQCENCMASVSFNLLELPDFMIPNVIS